MAQKRSKRSPSLLVGEGAGGWGVGGVFQQRPLADPLRLDAVVSNMSCPQPLR